MADTPILRLEYGGNLVATLSITTKTILVPPFHYDVLACKFEGAERRVDAVEVLTPGLDSQGLDKGPGPRLVLLPGATLEFKVISPLAYDSLAIRDAALACSLVKDDDRTVRKDLAISRTQDPNLDWFYFVIYATNGDNDPSLLVWKKKGDGTYAHSHRDALKLGSTSGETVELFVSATDEAFNDGAAAADATSRLSLRRTFGRTPDAFKKLFHQPFWAGGEVFQFGDEADKPATAYQWNKSQKISYVAIKLPQRSLAACWNAAATELLTTGQHSIRDGGFVSLVPYLPTASFPTSLVQLRFIVSRPALAKPFTIEFTDLLQGNGIGGGVVSGTAVTVKFPCFVTHAGQPLTASANVRLVKSSGAPANSDDPLWQLALTNLLIANAQTIRVGPTDLVMQAATETYSLTAIVTRQWAFTKPAPRGSGASPGSAMRWSYDAQGRLVDEGPSNVYVDISSIKLPLIRIEPGGQDPLVSEGYTLEDPYPDRQSPLVIPLGASANQDCWFTYKEKSTWQNSQAASIGVYIQNLFQNPVVGPVADCLVLDPEPLQILKVVARPPTSAPAGNSNLFATWTNAAQEGPSWHVVNPFFTYLTPPQALGEATEKFLTPPALPPPVGSAGVPPETGNDIIEGQVADMRFAPNARIDFVSTYLDQNYGEPGINTRRLLSNVGERDPGVQVEGAQLELLYGLKGTITYPSLRLAEIVTRLGEIPAQLLDTVGGRPPTATESPEVQARNDQWQKDFALYFSRLALLEPRDEHDLQDDLKQRDEIAITEGISFQPREVAPDSIRLPVPPYIIPFRINGLLPTPRLRYPISEARQAQTPTGAMPSKSIYHRPDGLPGGFQWGFESVAIYEQLWRNRRSSAAELAGLAFSALGGFGRLKAKFGELSKIEAHVGMGRTHYYTVERIGRIGVYWNKAKHVIVYERRVAPTTQFFGYQDDLFGRPVLRKVREYIEILQPDKSLPDNGNPQEDGGPVRGIVFHDRIILVHGSWGEDVYLPATTAPIGWQIPLWREAGVDTSIYPKPQVSLRMPTDGTQPTDSCLARVENPEDLWFYTDTRDGLSEDVMTWPTVLNVDYADVAIPPAFLPDQAYASKGAALEGDLADPPSVPPGLERFTQRLERIEQKANLVADRTDAGQVSAIVRNVTMMRATTRPADPTSASALPPPIQARCNTLAQAAELVTFLDQQWEQAAQKISQTANNDVAGVKQKVKDALSTAQQKATALQASIQATALKLDIPSDHWCTQPLVYWGVEDPLRRAIQEQRQAAWNLVETNIFQPWRQDLQNCVDVLYRSSASLADAQNLASQALSSEVLHFHNEWQAVTLTVSGMLQVSRQLLDGAMETAETRLADWFDGVIAAAHSLGSDANTAVADVQKLLDLLERTVDATVGDGDGIFTREVGSVIADFLRMVEHAAGVPAWTWWTGTRDPLLTAFHGQIATWRGELNNLQIPVVTAHIEQGLRGLKSSFLDPAVGLIPLLQVDLDKGLDAAVGTLQTDLHTADTLVQNLVAKKDAVLVELFRNVTSVEELIDSTRGVLSNWGSKVETDFASGPFATMWGSNGVEGAAKKLVETLCRLVWDLFPFDFSAASTRILDILGQAQDWAARVADVAEPWLHNAEELANRIRALGQDMDSEVHRLTGEVQKGIAKAAGAANAVDALAQAGSDKIRAFRAFCESPDIFPLRMNRQHIALVIHEGRKVLDMTPVVARYQQAKEKLDALGIPLPSPQDLSALGLRLPSSQLLDRILPANLARFDLNRVVSDLGGIRFDSFLPNLKMPSIADDRIKVSHGFDPQALRAWVKAEADVDLPSPSTLFSIGPVAVTLRRANFSATCEASVQADGTTSKQANGAVHGDWEVSIGGTPIVTFADTALRFDNGALHFDLQPAKIQLNALLKMISDLLPDMSGGDDEEDGPGISVGLTTVDTALGPIPSGVRVKLDLPLPDLSGGAFGITGLQLGAFFRLQAIDQSLNFAFQLATGFNLGRKESPFAITIFILGGGGWIEVDAFYQPAKKDLGTNVSIGITANAILAINLGVVQGSVGVYLGVFAEFHQSSTSPGSLAIGVMLMFRGDVDVCGIVSIYLMLLLEAIYESGGNGNRLIGRGTVELRIKICWCFTLKVRKDVTYTLAQSGGGGGSGTRALAASGSSGQPVNFDACTSAAIRQASLLI